MCEATGVILAGGASTRAGGPKALACLDGETLLARTVRTLAGWFPEVLVAVRAPSDPVPLPARRVVDAPPGDGPLAALATALEATRTPWAFVVGCDMPDLDAAFARFLIARASAGLDAVVPETAAGPEPLHAVWRTGVAPALRTALAGGEGALHRALRGLRVDRVTPAAYAHLPGAAPAFADCDTVAELRARGIALPVGGPA